MDKFEFSDIKLRDMLNSVKEFMLPKGDKRVLVVNMSYTASIYLPEEFNGESEIRDTVNMEIMFYNPNNYCKVACRVNGGNFVIVADHDSCWTEGVDRCTEKAFEALDEGFTKESFRILGTNAVEQVSDKHIFFHKTIGGFGNGFKFIDEPEIKKLTDDYASELETNF